MLRDPVDRAVSDYASFVHDGKATSKGFDEARLSLMLLHVTLLTTYHVVTRAGGGCGGGGVRAVSQDRGGGS